MAIFCYLKQIFQLSFENKLSKIKVRDAKHIFEEHKEHVYSLVYHTPIIYYNICCKKIAHDKNHLTLFGAGLANNYKKQTSVDRYTTCFFKSAPEEADHSQSQMA